MNITVEHVLSHQRRQVTFIDYDKRAGRIFLKWSWPCNDVVEFSAATGCGKTFASQWLIPVGELRRIRQDDTFVPSLPKQRKKPMKKQKVDERQGRLV